jgi:hypothetical protein
MLIDIIFSPSQPNNPFEIVRRRLVAELAKIDVPSLDVSPTPDQFQAVKDHLHDVAEIADRWLKNIGEEIRVNATTRIDAAQFDGAFADAIDGFAAFEIERAAEALADDMAEAV